MSISQNNHRLFKTALKMTLVFSLWLATSSAWAQPIQLEKLFETWQAVKTDQQDFTEEQFDPLLEISQTQHGQLSYQSPDRLEQHYHKPMKGSIVFTPTLLKIDLPNRQLEINVAQFPEISLLSQTLLNLLNGNLEALREAFKLDFHSENNQNWQLNLLPNQTFLKQIKKIEIRGSQTNIKSILLLQTSGDWRKLSLSPSQ